MRTSSRPVARLPRRLTVLLLLAALPGLAGCDAVRSATAAPGLRPGIDVPSHPVELAAQRLGSPPAAPGGEGGYAFSQTHPDGSPVTFDPCRPIHVVVRPDHEPEGGRALLLTALGEVSAATGLQFVDDGATDEGPDAARPAYQPERYGDRWAPVLVTWSSPAETSLLTDEVLGLAGPLSFGTDEPGSLRYVSGVAVFHGPGLDAQLRSGQEDKARAVLLHELGHLVGLAHVSDPFQVMFDTNAYPLPRYRAGDRRGLEQLGLGRCYDDY